MRAETRVLLAGALFATGGVLIKSCDFPSLQRAGLRAALAAATLFALLPTTRRWPSWRMLLLVPAYFGATCLFVVANTLTTAADAIFLQSTAPLWLVLLGPLLLHERPTRRDVVTLVGIAAGMLLCFLAPGTAQATAPEPRLGGAIALASGVCYALLLLGLRWLGRRPDAAGSQPPGASLTPRDEGPAAIAWGNACTFPIAFALMPVVGQTPIAGSAQDWLVIAVLWHRLPGAPPLALGRPALVIATTCAELWLAAILAGALILAPRDQAGPWVMAIGSGVVIWAGFVLPTLLVSQLYRGTPAGHMVRDLGYWLVVMVAQAALLQALGLVPPPA